MAQNVWPWLALAWCGLAQSAVTQTAVPNVVLIMADDLGYHDLGCYGHPSIRTPVLDQLAKDGLQLTSFYSGATVCTPSRMALLTGAYPSRLGWSKGVLGHAIDDNKGLSPQALTAAEIFSCHGYRTAITGKWHLGDRPMFLPQRQGFDQAYYIKRSNNQTDELWRGDLLAQKPFDNRLLTDMFTRAAIAFIQKYRDQPFFLYVPYTAPHFPAEPHPAWRGKSDYGAYGDVVEELDHRIGELLSALDTEGLRQRTIVVFLSDNGPEPIQEEAQAKPFRGKKWDALEGGTRVPCIVRWPGVVPVGRTSDALIAAIDLLPTLTHACGIDFASARQGSHGCDGVNVWETFVGSNNTPHARQDLMYWHGLNGFQAIRVGDWKLFLNGQHAQLDAQTTDPVLFHLSSDPAETTDVSGNYPERVERMRLLAKKRLAEVTRRVIPLAE